MIALLSLIGFVGILLGGIALFKPLAAIRISSRARAAGVLIAGMVLATIAGNLQQEVTAKELGYASAEDMKNAEAAKAKAEQERVSQEKLAEEAENKRKGFHCLSAWDGSHLDLKSYVEQRLRDPDSFEHVETRISPVSESGTHSVIMQYRARNGFGGMNIETARAQILSENCALSNVVVQ